MSVQPPRPKARLLFLIPALSAVWLVGCILGSDSSGPPLKESLLGQWFPCGVEPGLPDANTDCRWVEEEGLFFGADSFALTIGVWAEDPADRDSSKYPGRFFDGGIGKIVSIKVDSFGYALPADTLKYEYGVCKDCPYSVNRNGVSIQGEILTFEKRSPQFPAARYRRHRAGVRFLSLAEFRALASGIPE